MSYLLDDPAYLHILFNHLPIIGLAMALLVLVVGLLLRQRAMLFLGLALVAMTAGSAYPVGQFGDAAYPEIFGRINGEGRNWLDYHTHLADSWLPLLYVNAALAFVAIGIGIARRSLLLPVALLVAAVSVAGLAASIWIGKAGGRVMHAEFRMEDPPKVKSANRL